MTSKTGIHTHRCPACMRDNRSKCERYHCIVVSKVCEECSARLDAGETCEDIYNGKFNPRKLNGGFNGK